MPRYLKPFALLAAALLLTACGQKGPLIVPENAKLSHFIEQHV